MLAFPQSSGWQRLHIFGSSVIVLSRFLLESLEGTGPPLFPSGDCRSLLGIYTKHSLLQAQQGGNLLKSSCLGNSGSGAPSFPLHSLPPDTAGTQTSLQFITLHHALRRARIHHGAFHGGEGRENVKSFAGERSVATATGPDGHGRWDLMVPLSWKMNRTTCCDQRSAPQACVLLPCQHFLWGLGKAFTCIWVCNNSFVKENNEIFPSLPGRGKLG